MNRSKLLLFLCVFALSEVLLAAKKVRIRDVSGMKNSHGMRRARSVSCHPIDEKCNNWCKDAGASKGDGLGYDISPFVFCRCETEKSGKKESEPYLKYYSESGCKKACQKHFDVDRVEVDDDGRCFCQYLGSCRQ